MNVVANNLMAMNAQRQYNLILDKKKKSSEKLSSGYRINRAADDAAGLAISEKMRTQIRGLNKGSTNIQDGISLVQVADGALSTIHDILHRMNELSTQAANDTNTEVDRDAIQAEVGILAKEITRIGKTTTFNTMHILDDVSGEADDGSITKLITSPATDSGYLSEAMPYYDIISAKNVWIPCSTLDFSNINEKNVLKLDGQGFSFNCSQDCEEVFSIHFSSTPGSNSAKNLGRYDTHDYIVDINGCKTGSDVIDRMINWIGNNLPNYTPDRGALHLPGALDVSHSNSMIKDVGGDKLIIYANDPTYQFNTEEQAKTALETKAKTSQYHNGAIDCTDLSKKIEEDLINEFNIQCSSNSNDNEMIRTHRVNAQTLGVESIAVLSFEQAGESMEKIQKAIDKVSSYRSELGAYQNRLEHSMLNVGNIAENTQASESRIRDADMAKEMVAQSIQNIIAEAGQSMISQTNKNPEGVLQLLQ